MEMTEKPNTVFKKDLLLIYLPGPYLPGRIM
jgi:hypothetical protein